MSAEALVVASRAVVQTEAFKKQSRTSERCVCVCLSVSVRGQRTVFKSVHGPRGTIHMSCCWHCRWLRILEVGFQDLATYLQEQRAAGYTIIGEPLCMHGAACDSICTLSAAHNTCLVCMLVDTWAKHRRQQARQTHR